MGEEQRKGLPVEDEKDVKAQAADMQEGAIPAEETPAEATNGWLESFYSRFDHVPLRALDMFIGACILALIAVIAVGVMKAKGILP